jgi:hypothetical protein
MASELRVNTLKDASGNNSVALSTVASGSAKAWTNINGSSGTPVAQDSFNNGSITDNAAGDYTLSFTSSFGNANYTHVGMGGNTDTAMRTPCQQKSTHAPATNSSRYELIVANASSPVDVAFFGVANLGDLA